MHTISVYTVMDLLAEESGPPFYAPNDAVALRHVRQLVKDSPDFVLYHIGEYDYKTMHIDVVCPRVVDIKVEVMPNVKDA